VSNKTHSELPKTITVQTIARDLNCSEATVYSLFKKGFAGGGLDALKFGKKTLGLTWQLEAFIDRMPRGVTPEIGAMGKARKKLAAMREVAKAEALPPVGGRRKAKTSQVAAE